MVRWRDLEDVTQRAVRALRETSMGNDEEAGVETDERLVAHSDWEGRGVIRCGWSGRCRESTSASGSGLRATQAGTIFHIALSAPGSKATSGAKRHATIAHSAIPTLRHASEHLLAFPACVLSQARTVLWRRRGWRIGPRGHMSRRR
ncbi:hypothetical protein FIBSPDRAFT_422665 [Athelia psychrophila]|uniref:Uncharacterized protein n=1 Tax=Athelia psychrophila TaxID=1759441 RepID=A0A166MX02_9AGAM|nr:hypothetical protein FIBSPDRAFT_422665 [Fibularhizoctonia sp. CBS 109695]